LIASFALGAPVAYIALEILPCHWFGTAFEGACADGVPWTSIGIGLAVAVFAFSDFCYRMLRRGGQSR
jgi:hypothetical protein